MKFYLLGISRKAEAKDISPCCCDKDPTVCKSLCGFIDNYYCNGLFCICGEKPPLARSSCPIPFF